MSGDPCYHWIELLNEARGELDQWREIGREIIKTRELVKRYPFEDATREICLTIERNFDTIRRLLEALP